VTCLLQLLFLFAAVVVNEKRKSGDSNMTNGIHPNKELSEAFQLIKWWGPDPALRIVLEHGDPALQRAVMSEFIKYNVSVSQAAAQLWGGLQKVTEGKTGGF
jgi:hypothetical protein